MKGEGVYCSERGWGTCKEDIREMYNPKQC